VAESASAKAAAAHQTVSCSEITGLNCDYVAGADGNTVATVGHHVDQVMALLGMHMANTHQIGLGLEERTAIRARFAKFK
jgi:hypothetical protein